MDTPGTSTSQLSSLVPRPTFSLPPKIGASGNGINELDTPGTSTSQLSSLVPRPTSSLPPKIGASGNGVVVLASTTETDSNLVNVHSEGFFISRSRISVVEKELQNILNLAKHVKNILRESHSHCNFYLIEDVKTMFGEKLEVQDQELNQLSEMEKCLMKLHDHAVQEVAALLPRYEFIPSQSKLFISKKYAVGISTSKKVEKTMNTLKMKNRGKLLDAPDIDEQQEEGEIDSGIFSPTFPNANSGDCFGVFIPLNGNAEFDYWNLIGVHELSIVKLLEGSVVQGIYPDIDSRHYSALKKRLTISSNHPCIFNPNIVLHQELSSSCTLGLHLTFVSQHFSSTVAGFTASNHSGQPKPYSLSVDKWKGPFFWKHLVVDKPFKPHKISLTYVSKFLKGLPHELQLKNIPDPRKDHLLERRLIHDEAAFELFNEYTSRDDVIVEDLTGTTTDCYIVIGNINLKPTDLKRISTPGAYLNDHLMNAYMDLLKDYETNSFHLSQRGSRSWMMSTLLMAKLQEWDSRNEDLKTVPLKQLWGYCIPAGDRSRKPIEYRRIYVPINEDNFHWTGMIISPFSKKMRFYDSLATDRTSIQQKAKNYRRLLLGWMRRLAQDDVHLAEYYNEKDWTLSALRNGPKQRDGCNCGVFVLMAFDLHLDDLPMDAIEANIQFFRNKIGADIMRRRLLY